MNKPKFNAAQPFEIAKPKFDPSQSFEEASSSPSAAQPAATIDDDIDAISKKYGVDKDWLKSRQLGMGYYPEDEAERNIKAGKHGEHLLNAASSSVNSIVGEGLMGGLPSWVAKKLGSDAEEKAADELRASIEARKSGVDTARDLALSITPGAMAGKALGASKLASGAKALGSAGLAIEEGARGSLTKSNSGDELESAALGAGIGAGLEAVPYLGKGIKAAKRLIPATEDALPAVNKIAARAGSIIPGTPEAKAIEDLYANPALRRKAAATDFDEAATELLPRLKDADAQLENAVSKRFEDMEDASLSGADSSDLKAFDSVHKDLTDSKTIIADNKQIYGPRVNKLITDVDFILEFGGPKEAALQSYKKGVPDIVAELGDEAGGQVAKLRSLNARRYLDDFMKNKDFEKLSSYEKQAVGDIRGSLDKTLKESFTGSTQRASADDLFKSYKQARDNLMEPLRHREGSGVRDLDAGKLGEALKTGRAKGDRFERNIEGLQDFLKKSEPELGKLKEVEDLSKELESLRELSDMNRVVEGVKRSGGPTSQAVNLLTQTTLGSPLAMATGGASLPFQVALLPITNPTAWVKVVDGLNKAGQSKVVDSVNKASKALLKASPGLASRLYMMNKDGVQ